MDQNNQKPQQNQQNPSTNNAPQNQAPQQKPNNQPPVNNQPKPAPAAPVNSAQSKKNLIISGIIILIVLALLVVFPRIKRSTSDTTPKETDTEQADKETATGTNSKPAATGSVRGSSSRTLSRAEALVAYKGKMITITDDCKVSPESQMQPKGTTIMINNDTTTAHTVTIGPKQYRVSGLHYTLSWLNLAPGTLAITCDGTSTDATIEVQ